jgi:hypothetical protein
MRAITVQQPYAWAIATGAKTVENRTRSIPWASHAGQRVAIHAGKAWYDRAEHDPRIVDLGKRRSAAPDCAPMTVTGAVVAVATLAAVHWHTRCPAPPIQRQRPVDTRPVRPGYPALCSVWAEPDAWHLVLTDVRTLARPVPARGFQGLWSLSDEVLELVLGQAS